MGEAGAGNTYLEMASISTAIGKRINETVLERKRSEPKMGSWKHWHPMQEHRGGVLKRTGRGSQRGLKTGETKLCF